MQNLLFYYKHVLKSSWSGTSNEYQNLDFLRKKPNKPNKISEKPYLSSYGGILINDPKNAILT